MFALTPEQLTDLVESTLREITRIDLLPDRERIAVERRLKAEYEEFCRQAEKERTVAKESK